MSLTVTAPRSAVVDLRQYTLKPGCRDALIDVFDTFLVSGQEESGMHVIGQFRDLDDPDHFVWMRGFDSMDARGAALMAFYDGPVWQAHRELANATMVDSDDALLLNPLHLGAAYPHYGMPRVAYEITRSVVGITVIHRDRPVDAEFSELVLDQAVPELEEAGGQPLAVFVTDPSENNFPALPLRDENVAVWVTRFEDDDAYADHQRRLAGSDVWRNGVLPRLLEGAARPPQALRLRPTLCSQTR